MASFAADVVAAQCDPAQTVTEQQERHLKMPSASSVSELDSTSSSKSSLTSGYSSDFQDSPDKRDSNHSRSPNQSNPEDDVSTTMPEASPNDRDSSSSIPLEPRPNCSTEKNGQCCSELSSQPLMDSPTLTPDSRRRKLAITQMSQTVSPPQLMINNFLISDGSNHSNVQHSDARLRVTDLVMSDSDGEGDDDIGELCARKLHLGYPFHDEAVSESDYDTDSLHSSRSNSRRSSATHWN